MQVSTVTFLNEIESSLTEHTSHSCGLHHLALNTAKQTIQELEKVKTIEILNCFNPKLEN